MKVLVTGGASGLGEAITHALAAMPAAHVTFTYRRSHAAALALTSQRPNVSAMACDFTSAVDVAALVEAVASLDLDVLVNNATTALSAQHFHKLDAAVFEQNFLVNVMPVVRLTQAVLAGFRKKRSGRIITVLSSGVVNRPPIGSSEYTASKAYLHSLAKSWAVENASFGITSNCVSPSLMQTSLTAGLDERVIDQCVAAHPLQRLLMPQEVAGTVAFLAGPASAHINGANIVMNAAADIA